MNNIIKRVWNQNRMVSIEDLSGMAFQAEDGGHTFEISGINDAGESVPLSGTVVGVFMRPDGTDVALTGTASDGVVSVSLSDACYAVAGRFGLTIFVTADSKKTCVYACVGTVSQTSYGTVAGDTPQDVVDLINAINATVESIPSDYSDLSQDVSYLNLYDKVTLSGFTAEYGMWNSSGIKGAAANNRIRTANGFFLKKGDSIVLKDTTVSFAVVSSDIDGLNLADSGFVTSWTASNDCYVRININLTSNANIAEENIPTILSSIVLVTNYHNRVGFNTVEKLADVVNLNQIGFTRFDPSLFAQGTLSDGVFISTNLRRAATPETISFPYDITIEADDGWQFGVHLFNGDTFFSDTGWQTSYSVSANQAFKILIKKSTENIISVGVWEILVNHLKYTTLIGDASGLTPYSYTVDGDAVNTKKQKVNVSRMNISAPVITGESFQDFAVSNGVLFQAYSGDTGGIKLIDFSTGELIATLVPTKGHANSLTFSDEYYAQGDEFPLLYLSANTNPATVYVNRVTRSAATLVKTLTFPLDKTGYYAGHVLDNVNKILYQVGYTENSYFENPNGTNYIVVSAWDMRHLTDNGGSYTPAFIGSFELPFFTTIQGATFFDGKIVVISSHYSNVQTRILFVDVGSKRISTILQDLPTTISAAECEGVDFVAGARNYYMIVSPNNKYYYKVDFS